MYEKTIVKCPMCDHPLAGGTHNNAGDMWSVDYGRMACYWSPPGSPNMNGNGRISYCDCTYDGPGAVRY